MKFTKGLVVCSAAFSLWGCGGGGSTSSTSTPLDSGRAALVKMASGNQTTTTQSLNNAVTLFQQALKTDPTNPLARFGEAVALAGLCTDQMDGTTTTVQPPSTQPLSGTISNGNVGGPASAKAASTANIIPAAPTSGDVPPTPSDVTTMPAPVPAHHTLGLFWFLDRGLSNPYTLLETLAPITDLHLGLMPFSGYADDAGDVTRRIKLYTDLGTIISDLADVESDSTFSYTLPAPDQNGQSVTIGLPEVYLFDAYVNSLRTQVALSLAYVRDPGTYQTFSPVGVSGSGTGTGGASGSGSAGSVTPVPPTFTSPPSIGPVTLFTYASLDTNKDGKLEPSEYLPPSPFLTLRDATYLQTAQTCLAATAGKETLGITGVLARPAGGGYLIPNTTQIAAILNNIQKNVVPVLAQAAVGPITLTFPHYTFTGTGIYNPVAEGANGAGGVFQSSPTTVSGGGTTAPVPVSGGSGGSSGGNQVPTLPPGIIITREKVSVNLAAWFITPPADLKAFAPTYTLTSDGWIDSNGTVYPDPDFGGLFPNGLPSDLLP